jgi:hypothetical protein
MSEKERFRQAARTELDRRRRTDVEIERVEIGFDEESVKALLRNAAERRVRLRVGRATWEDYQEACPVPETIAAWQSAFDRALRELDEPVNRSQ